MKIEPTTLPGVLVIEPKVLRDDRGFFLQSYHQKEYAHEGLDVAFVQDNHSRSVRRTLRGLHAQRARPQGKLVRVIQGNIFDVAVDIRKTSPNFGRWVGLELSADNFRQCYIPPGFAHGFWVLSDVAEVEYKCTDFYDPLDEICLLWNDPDVAIAWPAGAPLLSAKDKQGKRLSEIGMM